MFVRIRFNSVLSILSYLCKAPLVPRGTPLVNALFSQRSCIENILRACVGLSPVNHMLLEHKHQELRQSTSHDVTETVVATSNGVATTNEHSHTNGVHAHINGYHENGVVDVQKKKAALHIDGPDVNSRYMHVNGHA